MARKVETILKRIARGVCLSEEQLTEFLLAEDPKPHLMWHGAHKPPTKGSRVVHTNAGLDRRISEIPRPTLRGNLSPTRLLFYHHYGFAELSMHIQLRCNCGATSCISPFHRVMTHTFRGDPVPLPELPISKLFVLVDMLTFDEESYRHNPENLAHYPPELVAAAFKRLGWET